MYTLNNFYRSNEWEKLLQVLKLERVKDDKLYCEYCGKELIKAYDIIGHHKIELTSANVNDFNISLNPNNIMLIHFRCHNQIHERFGYEKARKIYIVYGSPCSGKSTWVKENASKDDLIIDMDKIWECISCCDKYNKPNRLKQNVFGVHNTLIEQVNLRLGKWKNAFIIGGYPLLMDRVRLADKLGAELIHIDTDKETCLSRSVNGEWSKYINDWWEMFQPAPLYK